MTHQEQIINDLIIDLKSKSGNWYDEFNSLSRPVRYRLLKDIFTNYCGSILSFVNNLDPDIHIHNIGTLSIKPSRKQYLDLVKDGVPSEEAVKIVKHDYKKLNNKEK